jgi:excisionase family DNA binding protein
MPLMAYFQAGCLTAIAGSGGACFVFFIYCDIFDYALSSYIGVTFQEVPTMASLPHRNFDPVMPSEQETALAKLSSRALAPHAADPKGLRIHLEDGAEILLPASAIRLLVDVLAQMSEGNAVTLIPVHAEMTTQQAADFLNVSRPFLVQEVLEKGKIPYRKLGTHRRILFKDLMEYKNRQMEESKQAFRELTQQAQQLNMGY